MKLLRFLLCVCLIVLGGAIKVSAGDHPEANFGIYGIQHFTSIAQYQETYIGQVVQYLPQVNGGSYDDTKYFQGAGGKFNTDYVVSKISGNDERMTWTLLEKETGEKGKNGN